MGFVDRRLAQTIEVITTAAFAWFAFRLLGYFFSFLVMGVFLLAIANAVAVWMLRFDKQRLSSICSNRYIKYYITWICRITNTQPPILNAGGAPGDLLLHFDDDYRTAAWRARQVVMGHDRVIDNLLWRVRDAALLRKRQPANSTSPPLATFLLVGGEGIGKRFLSLVLPSSSIGAELPLHSIVTLSRHSPCLVRMAILASYSRQSGTSPRR